MDINLEPHFRLEPAPGADLGGDAPVRFDWRGLAARLSAAHELRLALAQAGYAPGPQGSFDARAALSLSAYAVRREAAAMAADGISVAALKSINPIPLVDRKTTAGIDADVAGPNASGGRGLI